VVRLGVKLKSLFLQSGDNNQSGDRRFPMSEGEVDEPFILTRRLARARTAEIRDYGPGPRRDGGEVGESNPALVRRREGTGAGMHRSSAFESSASQPQFFHRICRASRGTAALGLLGMTRTE